jgi:hypothetical protein
MARIPAGAKRVLLVWLVFAPYFAWLIGHVSFDGLPYSLRVVSVIFLVYFAAGCWILNVLWARVRRTLPPGDPDKKATVTWAVSLTMALVLVFGVVYAAGATWRQRSVREFLDRRLPQTLASDDRLRLLGAFVGYDGAVGRIDLQNRENDSDVLVASYVASARFVRGEARVVLALERDRHDWRFTSVDVRSISTNR